MQQAGTLELQPPLPCTAPLHSQQPVNTLDAGQSPVCTAAQPSMPQQAALHTCAAVSKVQGGIASQQYAHVWGGTESRGCIEQPHSAASLSCCSAAPFASGGTPVPGCCNPAGGLQCVHGGSGFLAEKATMLLLLCKPGSWAVSWADEAHGKLWASLMDASPISNVDTELAFIGSQLAAMDDILVDGTGKLGLEQRGACARGCARVSLDCLVQKHKHA